MKILLVEDSDEQRSVFSLFLRTMGHEVVECCSAADVMLAEDCEVALVDRHLPDGDGVTLACSLPGRVFLLTGDEPQGGERARLKAAEIGVLIKPIRMERLREVLEG